MPPIQRVQPMKNRTQKAVTGPGEMYHIVVNAREWVYQGPTQGQPGDAKNSDRGQHKDNLGLAKGQPGDDTLIIT